MNGTRGGPHEPRGPRPPRGRVEFTKSIVSTGCANSYPYRGRR
ncbi:hypothetical protein FRUB_02911 [Fimbriiglobus ruber]|uniref:Uncharacterized protein n=1 Tax=Fimbriiglobus ruber TaxID=1908690 RepID=A0A225DPJ5_9BACT|nr:hypothetical protein FRUB_02911 [Fimbriiglobus ruber]